MKVKVLTPAELELKEAYQYYDSQLLGLGARFLTSFEETVELIKKIPFGWRKVSRYTRRINIKNFPYLILYVIDDNTVIITFICHSHRNPGYYIRYYK